MTESLPSSPDDSSPNRSESTNEISILDYLIHLPGEYYQRLISRKPVASVPQDSETTKSQDVLSEKEGNKESIPFVSQAEGEIISSTSASSKSASVTTAFKISSPDLSQQRVFSIRLPFGLLVNVIKEPKQKSIGEESIVAGSQAVQQSKPKLPIKFSAKRKIKPTVIACSLLLSLTGLWLLFQLTSAYLRWASLLLVFNGFFIFIFSTRVGLKEEKTLWDHILRLESGYSGIRGWQQICLCASGFFAVVAMTSAGDKLYVDNPLFTVAAWLGAIVLAIIGGWQTNEKVHWPERNSLIAVTGFIVIAFILRGTNAAIIPNVLTGDEASSGLAAVEFVRGEANNIFTISWFSFPSFFHFVQSLFIRLFGQTTEALRLLSALAGALTVGAVYVFGWKIFNKRVGLFAAVFLLFFHYHNHFSRIGLNNIWDGLWFTAVIGLLWYGWEKNNRTSFLFCGLIMGLAQYFYVSSRALLFLVPLLIIILSFADRKSARQHTVDVAFMAFVCLIVVLPLMFFFIRHPLEYNAPFQRATIFGEWMTTQMKLTGQSQFQIILDQIRLSIFGLISMPLRAWYEPTTPLLRPISVFLFMLGLIFLMLKWKTSRAYLLFMWLGVIILMGALSENTPAAQRYVAAAPVIALIIGFGLAELGMYLGKIKPRYTAWILSGLLAILVVFGVEELKFYYLDYSPKALLGGDNGLIAQRLADNLKEKDSSWQVAFFGWPRMGYYSFSTIPYLAPNVTGIDQNFPWGSPDNPPVTGDHLIFVFLPEHLEDLKAVQADYPNGSLHEERYKDRTLYWSYEVSSP